MFKSILNALRNNPLIDDSYDIMDELHHQTQEMFLLSMKNLIDQDVDAEKIIKMDKDVNKGVQRVRRKVFEYFSMTSTPNIHGGLTFISLVIDYERIGDYAKDLVMVREEYDLREGLSDEAGKVLNRMKDQINLMFLEAHDSFVREDQHYPTKVTKMEAELKELYDELREITLMKNLNREEALVVIISARLLKRIAGHLDNIASSAARPFPKLGFKPGASSWED